MRYLCKACPFDAITMKEEDKMARKDRMSGNESVSYAIRQINPDVMPAFQSLHPQKSQMVSTYIATETHRMIPMESEQMSAAIGSGSCRSKNINSNIFCRTCARVGKNYYRQHLTACSIALVSVKSGIIRTNQYQL